MKDLFLREMKPKFLPKDWNDDLKTSERQRTQSSPVHSNRHYQSDVMDERPLYAEVVNKVWKRHLIVNYLYKYGGFLSKPSANVRRFNCFVILWKFTWSHFSHQSANIPEKGPSENRYRDKSRYRWDSAPSSNYRQSQRERFSSNK